MNIKKKLVIIGAGLSTHIFLNELNSVNAYYDVTIIEKKEFNELIDNYDDVPFYFNKKIDSLNLNFEQINVKMSIYDNNKFYEEGNEFFSEKYSKKILGKKSGNTIKFLEKNKKAYVLKNNNTIGRKMMLQKILIDRNKKYKFLYNLEVKNINLNEKKLILSNNEFINYDLLISTIPLNFLMNLTNMNLVNLFYKPFHIIKIYGLSDNDYKVSYCTDFDIRITRIARLGDTIFIESPDKLSLNSLNYKENIFINKFITKDDLNKYHNKSYKVFPGRFSQIDLKEYNVVKNEFCANNIYLLGRLATWRFKLVEDIVKDSKEIINILEDYE